MNQKTPNNIRPRANEIIVTANLIAIEQKEGKVIDSTEEQLYFDEFQKVVSIGSIVRDIKVGDVVCVNPKRFAQYQEQKSRVKAAVDGYERVLIGYDFPIVTTSNGDVMIVTDSDIKYIVDGGFYEDINTDCNCCFCDHITQEGAEMCNTYSPYMPTLDEPGEFNKEINNEAV